ncbi:MAG: HAD-IIIC family phosphatase [Nitrospirae bacterium]|nr:HAD-IIIC family phosphatase [Nitrospirota bacterium]MBF0519243.1 HAD-IIIC family phosphatase [Nitrospirota bacterium]MBF0535775.1 HAD-IIIC family phosphatase [Nitrospirota bacterium]MBF0617684.1 HAD-IIIC family phosphatase [Nitrospirota bacterium]
MSTMSYVEIIKKNRELKNKLASEDYTVGVLTNITNHFLKDILEYSLRLSAINAIVEIGGYDNIVQDADRFQKKSSLIIVFWELINFMQGLHRLRPALINDYEAVKADMVHQIDLLMDLLKNTPLIIFNRFTNVAMSMANPVLGLLDKLAADLNKYMDSCNYRNVYFVDLPGIFLKDGIGLCLDWRNYYRNKSLYTLCFYKTYCDTIINAIRAANGQSKKMLILDCDNTLWDGIVDENGIDGIDLSADTANGAIFSEVRSMIKELAHCGILIALCSKNNSDDIDKILTQHPGIILSNNDIVIKMINWDDKVTNIKLIAETISIGLDSMVFIDDSAFEVEHVRGLLPEVNSFKVPDNLYDYPALLREISGMFYTAAQTTEDLSKQTMYRQQFRRESSKREFDSLDDYLASLDIQLFCYDNDLNIVTRLSQLSQKTNQFNLTTRRYTERQIENFITDAKYDVLAYRVKDKFGDNGITAMVILQYDLQSFTAIIDSFTMSCRIIGRNIEFSIVDHLIWRIKDKNIDQIEAVYIPTQKNVSVKHFYDKCSFQLLDSYSDAEKRYVMHIDNYSFKNATNNVMYANERDN